MKTFLTKFLALSSVTLLMLSACKKDGTLVTSTGGKAGTLTANSTTVVLQKANLSSSTAAVTFSFTQPTYGFNAAVTNTLQIDVASDNWKAPVSVTLGTNVTTLSYNTSDLDALLLKLGLKGGVASQVQVRIMHSISATVTPIYSNVLSMTVTPFNLTAWIYVVGAFQGWNASAPDSLISATSNGVYTGIINFTAGNNAFLILPAKNYNNKYATTQSSVPTTTVAYNASNNLMAPATAGQYIVTFDSNAGTITFALANLYSAIGNTVGDAGGYSIDVPLTKYVNDGVTGWQGIVPFNAGNFKIRQNDDWTFSWGTLATPDGVTLTDNNGGNITIAAAGNYKVTFNIPTSAIGTTPSVTATYTVTKQ